jgi:hypothetical protein
MKITINLHIQNLIVVGDSKTVIQHMVQNSIPVDTLLAFVIERTKQVSKSFSNVHFYRVLKENNTSSDNFSNQAT